MSIIDLEGCDYNRDNKKENCYDMLLLAVLFVSTSMSSLTASFYTKVIGSCYEAGTYYFGKFLQL